MCLGIVGRGNLDEEDWLGTREDDEEARTVKHIYRWKRDRWMRRERQKKLDDANEDTVVMDEEEAEGLQPLHLWENKQLIATRCSNDGAVVEWIVVPFMYEEAPDPLDGEKEELEAR
jgi:hypothetical protein